MDEILVKYRTWHTGVAPKPIRLQVPGWAGCDKTHGEGSKPQPWHCPPFVEGSTYGHELIYPFKNGCVVRRREGRVVFDGDFSSEEWNIDENNAPLSGSSPRKRDAPMIAFAPGHYGMSSCLDMEPPEGYVMRTEPHPRFYTDDTGTFPCMLAGHIQRWWSRIFFVVFKSPREGEEHVFTPGEPYGQVIFVPQRNTVRFEKFSYEEERMRESAERKISNYGPMIATHSWKDNTGWSFDNKYKVLSTAYAKGGYEELDSTIDKRIAQAPKQEIKTKLPRRLFTNEKLQDKKEQE